MAINTSLTWKTELKEEEMPASTLHILMHWCSIQSDCHQLPVTDFKKTKHLKYICVCVGIVKIPTRPCYLLIEVMTKLLGCLLDNNADRLC